eukprot:2632180-Amphidinium_carterae.1
MLERVELAMQPVAELEASRTAPKPLQSEDILPLRSSALLHGLSWKCEQMDREEAGWHKDSFHSVI